MKIAKSTFNISEFLRRSQSIVPGAPPGRNARVRYFHGLMSARPLQFAERLLAADPAVNTGEALARLWDECLRSGDSKMAESVVKSLVEFPEASPQQKRLTDSITRVTDFQAKLVPALTQAAQAMKDVPEEQRTRVANLLETLKPPPEVSSWQASYLPYLGEPPVFGKVSAALDWTPPPRRVIEDADWRVYLALSAAFGLFLCGVFLYDGDLPADAGIGQRMLRRALSLIGDVSIIAFFGGIQSWTRELRSLSGGRADRPNPVWQQVPLFVSMAAFGALQQYFPPITYSAQAILFLFNIPLTFLCVFMAQKY